MIIVLPLGGEGGFPYLRPTNTTSMQRDTAIFSLIQEELERQRRGLELIASENFTSMQVMQAMGSVMTNKYAEGYPGRRYYGGQEFTDQVEQLANNWLSTGPKRYSM